MKRYIPFLLTALVWAASLRRLEATTMVRLSLEQLAQASSAIVRGHVVGQSSHWNAQHTEIVTDTTIAVEQAAKGSPGATVVVRQLGGTVGNWHTRVPGSPRLLRNTSYMLFLEPAREEPRTYLVVGMMEGAYPIYRDPRSGQERVLRPLGDGFMKAPAPGVGAAPDTVPLAQFRENLRQAVKTPMVVPAGTSLPVVIESAAFQGVGRFALRGRVTATLYPSDRAVVPAGSEVEGAAEAVSGAWRIHWSHLVVRGARVRIQAASTEPGGPLQGRTLLVKVR